MSEEQPGTEYKDDRDDRRTVYGLPDQNKLKFNKSMIWVPLVIGLSVAAGVMTTRGIQRVTKGVPKSRPKPSPDAPQTMAKATSAGSSSASATESAASTVNTKNNAMQFLEFSTILIDDIYTFHSERSIFSRFMGIASRG